MVCSVEGCERPVRCRALCGMHYQRDRIHGTLGPAAAHGKTGPNNPKWRGGRVRGGEGMRYWMVYVPGHPRANTLGYVLEHRLVMEQELGRLLEADEIVHHKNEDTLDNDPGNLEIMTQAEHARLHILERQRNSKGQLV